MNFIKLLLISIISSFVFLQCNENQFNIDVSDIKIDFKIKRLEKDLLGSDLDSLDETIIFLQKKYSDFLPLYNHKIIGVGSSNKKEYVSYLKRFISYEVNQLVYQEIKKQYPNLKDLEINLSNSFKRFKYYFPNKDLPNVYSFISGLQSFGIVTDKKILGIGLDSYLGKDFQTYKQIGLENYKIQKMYKERIIADCMIAWLKMEFPSVHSSGNLLSQMIYEGKIMYILDALLPKTSDSIKIAYTKKQLDFCINNEAHIWTYFIEHKLLFSTKSLEIRKYINDAPFTITFSKKSPSRTAIWTAWQIVRAYMKNNPDISLKDLMQEKDVQKILSQSKYNP